MNAKTLALAAMNRPGATDAQIETAVNTYLKENPAGAYFDDRMGA